MSPVVASRRLTPARVLSFLFANLVWLAPFFLAPATNASAATDTYYVHVTTDPTTGNAANCPANSAAGGGSCSLRDAMTAANADATATAIVVDMTTVSGTITLGSNLTQISLAPATTTIEFDGPGANALTVSGNNAYQEFVILDAGGATFQNFTVANGFVSATGGYTGDPGYGAAIYAYLNVPLTLTDMVITNNYAANGAGGVLAGASIAVTQTTFSNNSVNAANGGIAGALYAIGSPATIYQSTFSGNSAWIGASIYIYSPVTVTISDSTFANNATLTNTTAATGGSGGIYNSSGSTLTIHDSTLWNNTATYGQGAALNNSGTMTVTDSIVGAAADTTGAAECYTSTTGCPTNGDANGNVTAPATFNLAALGSYGGPTQTVLPLPGSAAVCGGKTGAGLDADASGNPLTQDQRTLPLDASCAAGTTDAGSVQVNYLTVTTTTDSNDGSCTVSKCSLRDAITAANTANSGDIAFSNSLAGGTINLASNLPGISATGSVNIVGPSGGVIIDGGGKYQPFYISSTSASVGLVNLTLQNSYNSSNGGGVGYGAAILDYGTLSVTNVNFLNNAAGTTTTQGEGAAILNANASPLTVTDCYFANNTAIGPPSDGIGGAILTSGTTTITGSTFYKNSALTDGGAIYTVDGNNLTISNSTFGSNSGPVEGGAIWSSGPLTATNSTFADNTSADGTSIFVDGANASLTNSILDAAEACDATGCPGATDASTGNVVGTGAAVAGTVDNNGGSIPTALPVGASLCGGNASLIPGGYTDERGDTTVDPHCTAGLMDSGAVQSDYTSVAFSAANYDAISASPIVDPSVIVYVYEFGNTTPATSAGGVPITLDYTGTGTVNAGGTASTVAGSGATYSALTITSTATTPQPVSAAILGSSVTAATATITFKQGTATTTTPAAAAVPFSAATQNVTLNATLTPAGINEGNVTFTVCTTATNPCTGTVIGTATASGTVASSKASVSYALPAGLAIGSYTIDAEYIDGSSGSYASSKGTATLKVTNVTIAPTTLTAITVGVPMTTQTLTASGGTGPYTYAVTTGSLPAGISLNASTGALTGTATEGGSIAFTVTATDSLTATGTQAYTWTVNAATLAMAPTPGNLAVSTNITFTQAFTASAGTAPYTYTETGTLPTGLTWTAGTGTISGKTTQTGSFPITITAKDSSTGTGPYTQGFAYTLVVTKPAITIAPTTLTAITVGTAMTTQTLVASGGTGPYSYTVTTGSLPAGISLNASTGALTGTATQGGSIAFTVTATDANANTGTQAYTWTVNAATLAMAPTPGNLAVSTNITFTQAFTASAGTAPYTYTETGTLPTGLTWTAGTGTISGKATQTGSFPITVTAKDSSTGTGPYTQGFAYTLVVSSPTISIAPTTLTAITVGVAMPTQTLVASGGTGPYSYTVTTGSLPAGISLNASTGALTGTATQGGSIAFTVTATDANTNTGTQAYTWTVNAPTLALAPAPGNLAVTTNITFTQAFTASAGTAPYTYTETGTLPTGLTWTAGTGTISGKTAQTGSFPITITAKDSSTGTGPYSQNFAYTLVVTSPTITVAPTTLTAITVGVAMPTQTLVASGGTGPYSYTVTTGSLPAGISLNSSTGALTGTATQGGSIAFTVTATDANTNTGTHAYTWTVNAPTLAMAPTPGNLAVSTNITFTQAFTASAGTAPYTYTETGTLPTGLTWTAGTGTISGKATQTGSFPITITAKDSSTGTGPYSQNFAYTLVVTSPTIAIAPTTLAAITVGVAMPTQTLVASGGTGPYTYAVTTGSLPAGISLNASTGALTGTATQGGSIAFTVTATDANTNTGTQAYTWTVNAPTITLTPPAGNIAVNSETAFTQTFTATGGTAPYTYVEAGTLPTGLTWTAGTATIAGTATQSGSFPITITATDHSTGTGSPYSSGAIAYTLVVAGPTITMTPAAGPLTATVATAFTQAFVASGGLGPYTYTESGTLPAGITFSGNTLSGTPTQGGTFAGIIITAKDADAFTHAQTYTLTVNAPTITLAPPAGNIAVTAETAFTQAFLASGGTSPYTYVEAGTLPTGLTWTAGTGTIAGTATQSGSFPITITATDHSTGTGPYSSGAIAYTLVVGGPTITISPTTLPAAAVAVPYSQQLTSTGGTGTVTWSETGALPAGITLSTAGLLSGTPTVAGSFPITVTAKDTDNFTGMQAYTLTVGGPVITVLPATLPAASTYVAFTQTFTASGGTSPYTWSETGTLPTGITFNTATATLSGTPTQSGTFPITITVTDSTTGTGSPFSKSVGYTLAVSAPTITIGPSTLPAAAIAVAYTQSVTATGGTGPYTYSVTTGALPAGLALSTAGAITGTPTAGGSFSFTITAKDSGNFTGTQNYTLAVSAPTLTLAPPAGSLTVTTNSAFSQTFTASGGTAPYTYTESGALPAGLTFVNGLLSGTATASGIFPITVTAKDSSTGTGPYSSAAIAYTLNVGTTSISITWANPSAITYGTNLSTVLDATVTYNGNPVPGTFVYTATPSGGSAATVTATTVLAAGSYTLTANFTPTSNAYSTPSPKTVPLTVNQAQPTITWTPATTLAYGSNLSALLNATAAFNSTSVAGAFAYTATPTGGSAVSVTGTTVLMEGTYTLTATFTPTDATDYKTATATSPLTVTGATLTVSANNASKVYGTANPTFTGTITGQQNGDTFTESFSSTATTSSNVGTYPIVPTAAGANLSDYTVVVNDGTLTITQAASTTTLAVNSTSVSPGATVTLTATVASATTGTPTGTVSFYDGTTLLNTATLAGGIATFSTTTLAPSSSNSMTAVYSGDVNFTGSSTASPIVVMVGGLDFTLSASPANQNGLPGTTFTYQIAVAPAVAGQPYPGQVTFLVTGLPPGATATETPSTIAVGDGPKTVSLSIVTSTSTAAVQPLSTGRKLIPVALAFLLLPLAGTRRMRRQGRRFGQMVCLLLLALGGIVATTALSGCGSSNGAGFNKPGQGTPYTIAIKATSGAVTHSTTVTLTLQ